MIRAGPGALVAVLAGCNQVFGLEAEAPRPDAAVDGVPAADAGPDAPIDGPPCDAGTVTAPVVADAIIIAGSSQSFGQLEVCNVSQPLGSIGLFRFDLSGVPAGAGVVGLTLTLPYAPTSNACGTGCGACDAIDTGGAFTVAFMRSDWNEATVDWFEGWTQPGASGTLDRSAVLVVGDHAGDADTAVAVPVEQVPVWRAGDLLSIQVVAGAGTALVVAAREKSTLEACPPAVPAAALRIDYCR